MQWGYILLVLCAGAGVVVQAGMNAELRKITEQPAWSALVSFGVGILSILVYFAVSRGAWPAREQIAAVPPWAWIGGIFGAFIVVASLIAAPRLGAGPLVAATVVGQLVASVVIDHFGWVGFAQRPLDIGRVVGVLLMVGGVFLIART